MASVTTTRPTSTNGHLPSRPGKPTNAAPLQTMIAAASVLSRTAIKRSHPESWQQEAWDLYDEVGELRFVANAVASAMSHARLYVGRLEDSQREDPIEVEDGPAVELLNMIGGGPTGRGELLRRMGVQLFVPGDGWLVGLPPGFLEGDTEQADPDRLEVEGSLNLSDLEWHVFSVTEVKFQAGEIRIAVGDKDDRTISEEQCYLVRVWRPHPRRYWMADSPVRANLPILRELVGLTKHIAATIDSRLAGAGLLILPESATIMGGIAESDQEDDDPEVDPFLAALMDAMITPIRNRDTAAAVVPVVATVRDDVASTVGQDSLIKFSTPFDAQSRDLRDEAIRRLALGLDVTPEMLLGMGAVNHWSAWLLDELNAKIHIEPVVAMICDALTVAYLRPALEAAGVRDADSYVVWHDLSELTLRPDRSDEAQKLHALGVLSDEALRRANGFDDTDAPPVSVTDPAVDLALELVARAPSLLGNPGLPTIVEQIRAAAGIGNPDSPPPPPPPADIPADDAPADGPPADDGPPVEPGLPASAARRPRMPLQEPAP